MSKEVVLADVHHILTVEELTTLLDTQVRATRFDYLKAGCAFVAACKHIGLGTAEITERCELFYMGASFPYLYQSVVLAARPYQLEQLQALQLA
jgi:hypothetical protein